MTLRPSEMSRLANECRRSYGTVRPNQLLPRRPGSSAGAGAVIPESIAIRMLLPDTSTPWALPCRAGTLEDDPQFRERTGEITRRHTRGIIDSVEELADLGLIERGTLELRLHRSTPLQALHPQRPRRLLRLLPPQGAPRGAGRRAPHALRPDWHTSFKPTRGSTPCGTPPPASRRRSCDAAGDPRPRCDPRPHPLPAARLRRTRVRRLLRSEECGCRQA